MQETKMNIVLVSKVKEDEDKMKAIHVEYMGYKKVFIVTSFEAETFMRAYESVKSGEFLHTSFAIQDIGYWLSLAFHQEPRVESGVRMLSGTILEHYIQRHNVSTGVYRNDYTQYWLGDMAREGGYDVVEVRVTEEQREHLTSES